MQTYVQEITVNNIPLCVRYTVFKSELPHTQDEIELLDVCVGYEDIMSIMDERVLDKIADEILKGGDDE